MPPKINDPQPPENGPESPLDVICRSGKISVLELARAAGIPHPRVYEVRNGLRRLPRRLLDFLETCGYDRDRLMVDQAAFMSARVRERAVKVRTSLLTASGSPADAARSR